jgi:hypothetical protein
MDRRFRIDKVALEFSGFVYDEMHRITVAETWQFSGAAIRIVYFTPTTIRAFTTKILSLTLG